MMRLQRQCIRYFVISTCCIKAASHVHVTSSRAHESARDRLLLRFADLFAAVLESWQNTSDTRVFVSVCMMAEFPVGCGMLWTHAIQDCPL